MPFNSIFPHLSIGFLRITTTYVTTIRRLRRLTHFFIESQSWCRYSSSISGQKSLAWLTFLSKNCWAFQSTLRLTERGTKINHRCYPLLKASRANWLALAEASCLLWAEGNGSFLAGTFEPMQREQLKVEPGLPWGTQHPDGYSCSSTAVYILLSWLRLLLGHCKGGCS